MIWMAEMTVLGGTRLRMGLRMNVRLTIPRSGALYCPPAAAYAFPADTSVHDLNTSRVRVWDRVTMMMVATCGDDDGGGGGDGRSCGGDDAPI